MCRKCETGRALGQYDPSVERRVEWLLRMKHHLGLGVPRGDLGVALSDLDDIWSVEIAMDRARAEAQERAAEEHERRMREAGRKGASRGVGQKRR